MMYGYLSLLFPLSFLLLSLSLSVRLCVCVSRCVCACMLAWPVCSCKRATHTLPQYWRHNHAPSTEAAVEEEEEAEEEEEVDETSPVLMTGTCRPRLGRLGGVGSCPNPVGITKPERP